VQIIDVFALQIATGQLQKQRNLSVMMQAPGVGLICKLVQKIKTITQLQLEHLGINKITNPKIFFVPQPCGFVRIAYFLY
jgi:hypothetical protein